MEEREGEGGVTQRRSLYHLISSSASRFNFEVGVCVGVRWRRKEREEEEEEEALVASTRRRLGAAIFRSVVVTATTTTSSLSAAVFFAMRFIAILVFFRVGYRGGGGREEGGDWACSVLRRCREFSSADAPISNLRRRIRRRRR